MWITSVALKATAKDSLSDVAATTVVLLSVLAGTFFHIALDGYGGLIVGIMIMFTGISAFKDTVDPLLGKAPDPVSGGKACYRKQHAASSVHCLILCLKDILMITL